MLSFPLFPFLLPDGIRQNIKAVLYECKRMINLGQCYEVCRTILFDNTCIYSCKKKQNVSPGEKKTPSAPTKGFWFVSADIPHVELSVMRPPSLGDCRYGATQLLYCLTSYVLNFKSEL